MKGLSPVNCSPYFEQKVKSLVPTKRIANTIDQNTDMIEHITHHL
jgi:hypothetical protein